MFYIETSSGPVKDEKGPIIFTGYSEAMYFAVNQCDLRDKNLEIQSAEKLK